MDFERMCGDRYAIADEADPESYGLRRRWPFPRHAGTLRSAVLAALAVAVLAGLLNMAGGEAVDSPDRPGVAMRMETAPPEGADGALGRGVLKVINDSGKAIALRLIGPEYSDSRTILVPAWEDGRIFGLAPGTWVARYCTGSGWRPDERRFASIAGCAELDQTIDYTEVIAGETLHYGAAVIRFGPSPRESPPAHAIPAEEFTAD
jgi:hypothetical protein